MKPRRTLRTHVHLPADLVREIDSMVGSRGRSAFLVETAREAVRRRKLLQFLSNEEPSWNDDEHTDLAGGSAAWVRQLRQESENHGQKNRRRAKSRRTK